MENTETFSNPAGVGANVDSQIQEDPAQTRARRIRWTGLIRIRLSAIWLHRSDMWREIRSFSSWFEFEATPLAVERNESDIRLKLAAKDAVQSFKMGAKPWAPKWGEFPRLQAFLWSLGIRTIHLDTRLERNQIEDIIGLLYCYRQAIKTGRSAFEGVLSQLVSSQGVHMSCTQTSLCNGILRITYTYCTLQFSRVVHWFETRNAKFHDHRTLFNAAPRYALAFTLIVTGPAMVLSALLSHFVLLTVIVASAAVLLMLIYMSFMIIGSVEYDNEEKAYRLDKAYGQLKEYTNRIRADIERARIVQEMFLPVADRMPFQDCIQWAAGFMPADEVGGDYFDVAAIDQNRVAILFSDVSGHGMAAAFVTAIMKTTFQVWLDAENSLEGLARQMNIHLLRLVPIGSFAAVFIAIYDRSTRRLHYANCGHQPEPWHIPGRQDQTIHALSDARNLIMGVEEQVEIVSSSVILEPEDAVLFVSDGLVENPNINGQLYGTERFESFLLAKRLLPPQALVQTVSNEARNYSRDTEQSDDRTVLALRIKQ